MRDVNDDEAGDDAAEDEEVHGSRQGAYNSVRGRVPQRRQKQQRRRRLANQAAAADQGLLPLQMYHNCPTSPAVSMPA